MCCVPHSVFLFDSDAFDFEYGTVLLRMNQGLDVSHLVEAEGQYERLCTCMYRNSRISMTAIMFGKYFSSKLHKGRLGRRMKHNDKKQVVLKQQHEILKKAVNTDTTQQKNINEGYILIIK